MQARPSAGIGQRVRQYRLLAGLSAQKLSDRIGGAISRGVIANIESGAKKDVTVDELFLLAYGIDVPPSVLVFPVDDPAELVQLFQDAAGSHTMRVNDAVRLFNGEQVYQAPSKRGAARSYSMALLRALERVRRASQELSSLAGPSKDQEPDPQELERARSEYLAAIDDLEALGVDRGRAMLI